ncbi:MAG: hypothetical protein ACKO3B_02805 [Bacteroidota bacterium]
MKKTIAFFMLVLFLFNMGGYYMVFSVLQSEAGRQLNERLDSASATSDETIEVKVPLNLPYPINSNGFERVKGTVKSGDRYFQLLKQKIENDTLTLVLVKDAVSDHIEKVIYTLDELQTPGEDAKGTLSFSFKLLQEFIANDELLSCGNTPWSRILLNCHAIPGLIASDLSSNSPPPKG